MWPGTKQHVEAPRVHAALPVRKLQIAVSSFFPSITLYSLFFSSWFCRRVEWQRTNYPFISLQLYSISTYFWLWPWSVPFRTNACGWEATRLARKSSSSPYTLRQLSDPTWRHCRCLEQVVELSWQQYYRIILSCFTMIWPDLLMFMEFLRRPFR